MPIITEETKQSIIETEKEIKRFIPDSVTQYKFFYAMLKTKFNNVICLLYTSDAADE